MRSVEDGTSPIGNKLTFSGSYTTPDAMRANVYMRATSIVGSEQQDLFVPDTQIVSLAI